MHKLLATGLGIGYIRKGGGTVASVVCCGIWYLAQGMNYPVFAPVLITLVVLMIGIWSATVVEQQWGKDSYRVVIDEIAGMSISLLFIPISTKSILIGLFLFRFFDIAKPLGIRKVEKLSGGWGVMFDDVLAGVYANLTLQSALALSIL
ncbi:phosphatidylglycerophosphatase A family protein [Spirosoma agri]|uniref:Phosphatidylglycerophosphatase A n=1 Tax=Spirosoma agri TaxID=1987381 RepID=A0A6M0ISY7_9BACT|nr:phosphatidylglycerophosphatase A [Spirosoma agri]NEU70701.1 phosphatidylglycerophosphatase A [Spirosoma agri]